LKDFLQGSLLIVFLLFVPYFLFDGHGIVESILISFGIVAVLSVFGVVFGAINKRLK